MSRRPPIYTRTDTLVPYTTLVRSPLDAIGNLQAADHLQLRRGHAGAAHHAPSLHPSGRRNDRDRPDLAPAALFEEQRNVEHDGIARAVAREEAFVRLSDRRVHARFQRPEFLGIAVHAPPAFLPVGPAPPGV